MFYTETRDVIGQVDGSSAIWIGTVRVKFIMVGSLFLQGHLSECKEALIPLSVL